MSTRSDPFPVMGYPERSSVEIGVKGNAGIVSAARAKIRELEAKADGKYKEIKFVPEPLIFDLD